MPVKGRSRLILGSALVGIVLTIVPAFEGLRLYAYRDPVGIPTICFGETKGVRLGMKKTRAECNGMLLESLRRHEAGMLRCLRRPGDLRDETYGAVLSWTYNVGVGAACKSTLMRKLNAGDVRGACNELSKWDKAKGRRLPGLTKRRAEERALCLKGVK